MLFHDGTCTVVDWQTLGLGPVMRDAAYFIGGALPVEERRAHEESLLRAYHDELLAQGVAGFSWEQCWEEYRRQCFLLLVMTIAPAMVVERTDRGDDMFMAVFGRAAQMAIDLNAAELLPEPNAEANAPLRPDPADEGTHDPGPEELWNESWYFDAISDDGGLGVYHRIGRLPNTDACLVTTLHRPPRRAGDHAGRFERAAAAGRRRGPGGDHRGDQGRAITASSLSSDSGWRSRARRPLTPITRRRFARRPESRSRSPST